MSKEIIQSLYALQDIPYRQFQENIAPGAKNVIGIRIPVLRKYAKEIIKNAPLEFLKKLDFQYYEEVLLEGFIIGYLKEPYSVVLPLIKKHVKILYDWSTVDTFVSSIKIIKRNLPSFLTYIKQCLKSKNEYTVRFGIVTLLNYYVDEHYIDSTIDLLLSIHRDEYYIQMAQAWALAECYIRYPKKVLPILQTTTLPLWVHNKTISKICESLRISETEKKKIKSLRLRA